MPIVPARPDDPSEATRAALDALPPLGLFGVAAHADAAFGPWLAYGGALLAGLELDPRLRELAILAVADEEGSTYESAQHEDIARRLGLGSHEIRAVRAGPGRDAALDATQRLVVRAGREMSADGAVAPGTLEALAPVLSPRSLVELALVAGHYIARA